MVGSLKKKTEVIALLRSRQVRGNAVLTVPPGVRLDHETDHVA